MANFDRIKNDPSLMAELIVDPKSAARKLDINPDNPDSEGDVQDLEMLARAATEGVRSAGVLAGIETPTLAWGIGAGCCSTRKFVRRA